MHSAASEQPVSPSLKEHAQCHARQAAGSCTLFLLTQPGVAQSAARQLQPLCLQVTQEPLTTASHPQLRPASAPVAKQQQVQLQGRPRTVRVAKLHADAA